MLYYKLLFFIPLISTVITYPSGLILNDKVAGLLSSALISIAALLSWLCFFSFLNNNLDPFSLSVLDWILISESYLGWSIAINSLTLLMLTLVLTVSALVHIYSIEYMSHDKSKNRFMTYLSFFTFCMVALVVSDNIVQLFFGWEGVGVASYLLIGFWHHKKSANNAAIKAFIVNRVTDFGFLIGISLLYIHSDSLIISDIINSKDYLQSIEFNFLFFETNILTLSCFFLFIGAMGKSAQFGFHTWLPDAMEGPTPVSALIHAATMVTAGVFLIVRFSEIIVMSEFILNFILIIGLLTAFFAATVALFQKDIKKVIAYSTCSQLGFMFVACGLGAFNVAIFHLITHGYFKALLFLTSGSVIHGIHDEQDMDKMGNLFTKMKITTVAMWIGTLAIIGFPFMSGYYSKDLILNASFNNNGLGWLIYIFLALISAMTAFYSFRLLFKVFHGDYRGTYDFDKIHESNFIILVPLFLLSIGAIFAGNYFNEILSGYNSNNFWNGIIYLSNEHHSHSSLFSLLSKTMIALAICYCVYLYAFNQSKIEIYKNKMKSLYSFFLNKWFFDELYEKYLVNPFYNSGLFLWKKIDQNLIDALIPNGTAKIVSIIANYTKKIQTGYLFDYTFIIIFGFTFFISIIFYFALI
ncbi:MAG: NADH-quinone oxidoreductase subunit L [Pelagibacteraceae bacterium]|nr:NADH-quinone oxidoreductase subunit L [Pelagibacteraceae bacterium]|tara:strand:- start:311 stop:2227 length:1917 start_codon:yes stop_codon:yes gene_type:complete